MTKGAITLTVVFEGMNLNRDEGVGGNILTLKKLHRGDEKTYSFISRQALRYSLTKKLIEERNWHLTHVEKGTQAEGKKTVSQFDLSIENIITSEEMDAFGYMLTIGDQMSLTRTATVRISNGISLEPYPYDQSLNANHEMARRANTTPDRWTTEDHKSLYKYSILIDLDRFGIDEWRGLAELNEDGDKIKGKHKTDFEFPKQMGEKGKIEKLNNDTLKFIVEIKEKIKRIEDILYGIKFLERSIQGRSENLTPLFILGGFISTKTPLADPFVELIPNSSRKLNKSVIDYGIALLENAKGENGLIIKGIVKEKFENGNEVGKDWKVPKDAIDELIAFVKLDKFKEWLEK